MFRFVLSTLSVTCNVLIYSILFLAVAPRRAPSGRCQSETAVSTAAAAAANAGLRTPSRTRRQARPVSPMPNRHISLAAMARAFGNDVGISGTSSAFLFGGLLATRVPSLVGTGVPAAVACGNGGMTYIPLNDLWFLDGDSEFWPSLHAGRYNYSSRVLIGQLSGNLEYEELHFAHAAGRFAPWVPVRQPGLPLNAPSVARWPGGRAGHAMTTPTKGALARYACASGIL
eukprot:COSAG06_NODE_1766_length_8438_cov_16.148099_1_plen_229_part_00